MTNARDHFPTVADLEEIEAYPGPDCVPAVVAWCRNLLADRTEAIWWANLSRREREGLWVRIRAVTDLCDANPGAEWVPAVRVAIQADRAAAVAK